MKKLMMPAIAAVLAAGMLSSPALSQPYDGDKITVYAGYRPGGGVDTGARLMAKHMSKHLDGAELEVENLPGGDGVVALNHLVNKAKPDGLTIAVPGRNWFLAKTLGEPGVEFDPKDLTYIGSPGPDSHILWVRSETGITSLEDLKNASDTIVLGGLSPRTETVIVPRIMAEDGFPVRVVPGYEGGGKLLIALDQGEIQGVLFPRGSIEGRRADLIESGTLVPIASLNVHDELPRVSEYLSDENAQIVNNISSLGGRVGLMMVGPPNMPEDRVKALRAAYDAMVKDPEWIEAANAISVPTGAANSGEALQEAITSSLGSLKPESVDAYLSYRKSN